MNANTEHPSAGPVNELDFRQLAEAIPHFIWTCRSDGWCDYLSPQWLTYTGIAEADALGYNWSDVVHPDDRPRLMATWNEAVANASMYDVECRIRRHDGEYQWYRAQGKPVKDATGKVLKWVGTSSEIHAMKQSENALRESEARKDQYIATLSHELRNPLAPLRSALHLLRVTGKNETTAGPVYALMERQVNHLTRLVDDLVELSRITRGTFELRKEIVDAASVIANAVETCDPLMKEKGHLLEVTIPEEPIWLDGDPLRLAQILANILGNAAKYTSNGGQITLEAKLDGGKVAILVRDNGIGMKSDEIPNIFEMFSRPMDASARVQSGLGVGLALANRLAKMHGGTISARSDGLGKGSEFTIQLDSVANLGGTPVVAIR